MRYILGAILAAVLFAGCASHRASSVAWAVRDPRGGYKIQITEVGWSAGGPCNFPQWPSRWYDNHRICTDTLEGVVPGERLTLSYGDPPYDWSCTNLQGSVAFSGERVQVALRVPVYADDGSIRRYEKYPLNGVYELHIH